MVYVPTKEGRDTQVVYDKVAGYKWQLEDGVEERIKEDLGL